MWMICGNHVDVTCINNLNYADDMVLPSVSALAQLLETRKAYDVAHGLQYHPKESEVMVFKAGNIRPNYVPSVILNGVPLKVVEEVKYLGHITSDLNVVGSE